LCLIECVKTYDRKATVPPLTIPRILTPENTKALLDVVSSLENAFSNLPGGNFKSIHYDMTTHIVGPLLPLDGGARLLFPSDVLEVLARLKIKLGAETAPST
jgi:hypothetical protein